MSLFLLELNVLGDLAQQFGLEYSDRCRVELARLVAAWQGPTELAGHVENDRILVLLPGARRDRALARAQLLKEIVERSNFPRRKRLTVGVGVAAYPGDAEGPKELESYADKALRGPAPARASEACPEALPVS
jgi:diguanylate cyclase (GGDEF)-like protein